MALHSYGLYRYCLYSYGCRHTAADRIGGIYSYGPLYLWLYIVLAADVLLQIGSAAYLVMVLYLWLYTVTAYIVAAYIVMAADVLLQIGSAATSALAVGELWQLHKCTQN